MELQKRLSLETTRSEPDSGYYFKYIGETSVLSLHKAQTADSGLVVSFLGAQKKYQDQKLSIKKDLLSRAVGGKSGLKVFDATLGLAQDAFKLCYLGMNVVGAESNPWVYGLVANAYYRELKSVSSLASLDIHYGPSLRLIDRFRHVDTVYMDPMFEHKKKALPKKAMQYLADLVTAKEESLILLLNQQIDEGRKVVVKRSLHADFLGEVPPTRSLEGKMIRFDIYE